MTTISESFASIWDALEASPAEAATMKARSDILIALQEAVDGWNLSRAEAAKRLSIAPARLDDLLHGRIDRFDLETLVTLAKMAGLKVEWRITPTAA